jgi:hypothetical protein
MLLFLAISFESKPGALGVMMLICSMLTELSKWPPTCYAKYSSRVFLVNLLELIVSIFISRSICLDVIAAGNFETFLAALAVFVASGLIFSSFSSPVNL